MLKLTTDKHEASRGLSATAELLVKHFSQISTSLSVICWLLADYKMENFYRSIRTVEMFY